MDQKTEQDKVKDDPKRDAEFWRWMQAHHPDEPLFATLMRHHSERKAFDAKHSDEKSWVHNKWSATCQFCEKFKSIADLGKEKEHWAFKPWDNNDYVTACNACHKLALANKESVCT